MMSEDDKPRPPDIFDDMKALRAASSDAVKQARRQTPPEGEEQERKLRLLGAPFEFVAHVRRKTRGEVVLLLAIYIYRRTVVCKRKTVDLRGDELAELGISRQTADWALRKLQTASVVQSHNEGRGRRVRVTLHRWRR